MTDRGRKSRFAVAALAFVLFAGCFGMGHEPPEPVDRPSRGTRIDWKDAAGERQASMRVRSLSAVLTDSRGIRVGRALVVAGAVEVRNRTAELVWRFRLPALPPEEPLQSVTVIVQDGEERDISTFEIDRTRSIAFRTPYQRYAEVRIVEAGLSDETAQDPNHPNPETPNPSAEVLDSDGLVVRTLSRSGRRDFVLVDASGASLGSFEGSRVQPWQLAASTVEAPSTARQQCDAACLQLFNVGVFLVTKHLDRFLASAEQDNAEQAP